MCVDVSGRLLSNLAELAKRRVRIADYSPLANSAAPFGVLEAADPVLPPDATRGEGNLSGVTLQICARQDTVAERRSRHDALAGQVRAVSRILYSTKPPA